MTNNCTRRKRTRGNGMGTVYKLPNGKWCAEVTLRMTKTEAGKDRIIPIADCIYPIVEELYQKAEDSLLTDPERKWYYKFHAALAELGIRPLSPHCCRHTCAWH